MTKMKTQSDQQHYFAEGATWAQDRRNELNASRRVAWIVASAATAIALCEAIALVVLMPLKTVVPYTLMVDKETGFVQALKPLDAQLISGEKALTQSFLVQYVIAREEYDADIVQSDYRKVGLWSGGQARADYIASMQASNPESPLVRYPRSASVEVAVKSVTPLNGNTAMVRYETRRRDAGGQVQPAQPWLAVIRYRFSGEPMNTGDRYLNPLGFQVLRYRRSQEALAPPDIVPTRPESIGAGPPALSTLSPQAMTQP